MNQPDSEIFTLDEVAVYFKAGKKTVYRLAQQGEIDFENEGGETYICGNPPYLGFTWQTPEQKSDLEALFRSDTRSWKSLEYVAGWFIKAADYDMQTNAFAAFVATNSICQGEQVPILWPLIFQSGHEIAFAHTSFKWANLASHNAGVTVVIVGISNRAEKIRRLFTIGDGGAVIAKEAEHINAYLVPDPNVIVEAISCPPQDTAAMVWVTSRPTAGIFSCRCKRQMRQ